LYFAKVIKKEILFCWLGMTDIKAAAGAENIGIGPVAQAAVSHPYKDIMLLNNWEKSSASSGLFRFREEKSVIS